MNVIFCQDCSLKLDFDSYEQDPAILSTFDGYVKGSCSQINISDPEYGNLTGNILSWKGIPYAEPPVGQLRFRKPVPIKPWKDLKDGTVFSNRCMQSSTSSSSIPISEDCLNLNIFVRAESYLDYMFRNGPKKPIFIYIHGGRFVVGSGSDRSLNPSVNVALADVIYVTINYR
jgi:para-nitrobenzyl esterase